MNTNGIAVTSAVTMAPADAERMAEERAKRLIPFIRGVKAGEFD